MGWYFFPWSVQYLLSAILVLSISFYLIIKNPRSRCYQAFFSYGIFTALWEVFAFLHRNAPTSNVSSFWFRVDVVFHFLLLPSLLLTIIYLFKRRDIYSAVILPALCAGIIMGVFVPIEITMTRFGWSYKAAQPYFLLSSSIFFGYTIAIIVTALTIFKRHKILTLRKKILLILAGFICFQVVGMLFTNLLLIVNPDSPPFGGFLSLFTFLFIAYAISLPTEKITIPPGKPLEILADDWLRFLRNLREAVPGKELGGDVSRFEDALKSMGLKDVVRYEKGELVFNAEQLAPLGINEIVWATTDFMRKTNWALPAIKEYTNVFVNIYKTISEKDKKAADGWLNTMIRKYGGFLDKQGVLDAMPKETKIPEIFKELRERRTCLFKEERPVKAYQKLKEALEHGFECLVISKLEPRKVEEKYDVSKASIFWFTFKEDENTINPKRLDHLTKAVSEFVKILSGSVVLLDCLDQIVLANGFEKSMSMLKEIKDLCMKNNVNLLISINPEMFEKEQLSAMKEELEVVET